jgi:hypothetical protein
MKKLYLLAVFILLILNAGIAFNGSSMHAGKLIFKKDTVNQKAPSKSGVKISDTRINKPDFLKTGRIVHITPFKPLIIIANNNAENSIAKVDTPKEEEEKVLSNVKVFPNPVEDELNLSFKVNKDSNVTIKIMDVLGNEITTLLSQKVSAGEQSNTFNIASLLNSGFYFIRLVVGDEVVVKRISVL